MRRITARPRHGAGVLAAAALAAMLATGCSSGSAAPAATTGQQPIGAAGSSVAPTTTTTSSSTAAVAPSSGPATTSRAARPRSPFESDPAVMALRAWAVAYADTVNAGRVSTPRLDALSLPTLRRELPAVERTDVGLHFPGPLPFTPIAVVHTDDTTRVVKACLVLSGFAERPGSSRPAPKHRVGGVDATLHETHGVWKLQSLYSATFACHGVQIDEEHS